MKKSLTFISALVFILLFSTCGKEQAIVNQLAGDWQVEHIYALGFDVAASMGLDDATYHFDNCRVKDQWCDGTITDPSAGSTAFFSYKVINNGANYTLRDTSGTETTGDILQHSSTVFVYTQTASGIVVEYHLKKI